MKINRTPTKTEYLLDSKINLIKQKWFISMFSFTKNTIFVKKSQIKIPNSYFTTTWFIDLLQGHKVTK